MKSGQDLKIITKGNQELSTLEVGGNLDIDLEDGSALSIASATVAGLVDILSSGDLTLSGSLAASDVSIETTGGLTSGGSIRSATGSMTLKMGKGLNVQGDITAFSNMDIVAIEGVTMAPGKSITAGGYMDIDAAFINMSDNSLMKSGADMKLYTPGSMLLGTLEVGGDLDIDIESGAELAISSATVAGIVDILSSGDLDLSGSLAAGDVTIETAGDLTTGGSISASAGAMTLKMGKGLNVQGDISALGNMNIEAVEGVLIASGRSVSAGGISIETDTLSLNNDSRLISENGITVSLNSFEMGDGVEISAVNDIDMTVQSQIILNGPVSSSAGSIQMTGTEGLDILHSLNAGQDIVLTVPETVVLPTEKQLLAGGNISVNSDWLDLQGNNHLHAGANLTLTNNGMSLPDTTSLRAGGDMALLTVGQVSLNGQVQQTGGSFQVNTDSDIQLKQDINAGGHILLNTPTDVYLKAGRSLIAEEDLRVESDGLYLGRNTVLDAGGNLALMNNTLSLPDSVQISSGGDFELETDGELYLSGTIGDIGGSLRIRSDELYVYQDLNAGESIELGATYRIYQQYRRSLVAGEDIRLSTDHYYTGYRTSLTAGDDISVSTLDGLDFYYVSAGGDFAVESKYGDVYFSESVTAGGDMSVQSGNNVYLSSWNDITAGSLSIGTADQSGAYYFSVGHDSTIETEADLLVNTIYSQDYDELIVGGDFTAKAEHGSVYFQKSVTAGGAVNLHSGRDIYLSAWERLKAQSLTIGSSEFYGAEHFSMGYNSSIETRGAVAIHTRWNQYLGSLTSHADGLAFELTSARGAIYGNYEYRFSKYHDASHLTATNGRAVLQAATGIGDPLVVDLPWLSAETESGNINILARADLEASLLKATRGDIYMTTLGALSIDELAGNAWLVVGDLLFARKMTMEYGSIRAENGVEVEELSLTGRHGVSFYAPDIRVTQVDDDGTRTQVEAQRYTYIKPASKSRTRRWGRFF